MPDYGILDSSAFQRGYDFQRQNAERSRTQNALSALGSNPSDPDALNALMRYQPQLAMKIQDDQRAQTAEQEKRNLITRAAGGDQGAMLQLPGVDLEAWKAIDKPRLDKIAQITAISGDLALAAKDSADWDSLFSRAAQRHPELAEFVGKFYDRTTTIAEADKMKEFLASQEYVWHQEGERPSFATTKQGIPVGTANPYVGSVPQQQGGGGQNLPRPSTPQEAAQLPPGTQFIDPAGNIRTVPGGAGPQTPQTFP